MLDEIVEQSNLYTTQTNERPLCLTKKELDQVVGILLWMGLVEMPDIKNYWSQRTRFSQIADVMTRNRFTQLLSHLHFVDDTDETIDLNDHL